MKSIQLIHMKLITNKDKLDKEIIPLTTKMFLEMKSLSEKKGFKLILIMDAQRKDIYLGNRAPHVLNLEVSKVANKSGINFIDLTPYFADDYGTHGIRFNPDGDGHWNSYAHSLVLDAIQLYITQNDIFSSGPNLQQA